MPNSEYADVKITYAGGGSGPETVEDAMLDETENVTSVVSTADNGGDSGGWRTVIRGLPAVGDCTRRFAGHVRDPEIRKLLTHRHLTGARAGNSALVAAMEITGGTIEDGLKLLERSYKTYVGRVIPVSTESFHLKIDFDDGTFKIGEEHLDRIKFDKPAITRISYVCEDIPGSGEYHPCKPKATDATIEAIMDTDLFGISSGSWRGSIEALLGVDGVYQAIRETPAKIAIVINVVDFPNWTAQRYMKETYEKTGRMFDLAVVTDPDHELPPAYPENDNHHFVKFDLDECYKYAHNVVVGPFSEILELPDSRTRKVEKTIRHKGPKTARVLLQMAKEARDARSARRRNLIFAAA